MLRKVCISYINKSALLNDGANDNQSISMVLSIKYSTVASGLK